MLKAGPTLTIVITYYVIMVFWFNFNIVCGRGTGKTIR